MANLSAHMNWRIVRWAARNKVELCFNPTNASRANPIEAHFELLRHSLSPTRIALTTPSGKGVAPPLALIQSERATHPDVLAAQRRERARIRSEKGIRWGGRPRAVPA
jgi:hypothetical protein